MTEHQINNMRRHEDTKDTTIFMVYRCHRMNAFNQMGTHQENTLQKANSIESLIKSKKQRRRMGWKIRLIN